MTTDTIHRHLKGTAGGGRFAPHINAESPITLTDIDWAREVTGTAAASDARYNDVMAQVFAAASSSVDPGRTSPADSRVPSAAVFDAPVPAEVDGDGGRVTGGPDDMGRYAFTEHDSCEPYRLHLHHMTFTDPDRRPTQENYAASLTFIAGENRRDAISGFFRSRSLSAVDGADAADALYAAVDRTVPVQPGVGESLDELGDLTKAVTAARRSGMDAYAEDMMRLNEKAMRAGISLAENLGYITVPAEDS